MHKKSKHVEIKFHFFCDKTKNVTTSISNDKSQQTLSTIAKRIKNLNTLNSLGAIFFYAVRSIFDSILPYLAISESLKLEYNQLRAN